MKKLLITIAILVIGGLGALFLPNLKVDDSSTAIGFPAPRDENRVASTLGQSCVPTHSVVEVGDEATTALVSASKLRAWVMIQQPLNATNTLSLNITAGDAVDGEGISLTNSTTTAGLLSYFEIGIDVDRPATSTIAGITNLASTTALVTDCLYD